MSVNVVVLLILAAVPIAVLLVAFIVAFLHDWGVKDGFKQCQQQAAMAGAGRYVVDENTGDSKFEWVVTTSSPSCSK